MTEKESAHPLSPSVDVDIGKVTLADNGHEEDSAEDAITTPEPQAAPVKPKSVLPVSLRIF